MPRGGARPNTGGARPGAGRPKAKAVITKVETKTPDPKEFLQKVMGQEDPKEFLIDTMENDEIDLRMRMEAAKALMPFMHVKLGEGGKKDKKDEDAKKAGNKFGSIAPPRLVANAR
jgi:phage terminase small subunit